MATQTADCVVMARPRDFGFNEETGQDNEFQTRLAVSAADINRRANTEFQHMADRLRAEGVEVLILEPAEGDRTKLPDAVFPNNWLSTEHDGAILVYPMMAPTRRAERRLGDLKQLLRHSGRVVGKTICIGGENEERFLEGTGSLVIDHAAQVVYAACSGLSSATVPGVRSSAIVQGRHSVYRRQFLGQADLSHQCHDEPGRKVRRHLPPIDRTNCRARSCVGIIAAIVRGDRDFNATDGETFFAAISSSFAIAVTNLSS